jgi:hypothetical protein
MEPKGYEFQHDGWRWQVVQLPTMNRVQLWHLTPGDTQWRIGHGRDIPTGMSFERASKLIEWYIVGTLTHEQYNALLPV